MNSNDLPLNGPGLDIPGLTIPGLDIEAFLKFTTNPWDTAQIIKVQEVITQSPRSEEMTQWVLKAALKDQNFQNLYEQRVFSKLPTVNELSTMPQESLGFGLYKHITENNLSIDFEGLHTEVFYKKINTPLGYLGFRALTQHDVYHVVLGLGVHGRDEYNLASFQLGQFYSPYHMAILSSAILHITFYQPQVIPKLLDETVKYYELGKRAKFFPGFQFENHWQTPLSEVRRLVGVE